MESLSVVNRDEEQDTVHEIKYLRRENRMTIRVVIRNIEIKKLNTRLSLILENVE